MAEHKFWVRLGCQVNITDQLMFNAFQTKMWHSNLEKFRRVLLFDAEKVCVSERFWLIGRRKRSVQLSPPGTIQPISPKCTI